MFVDARRVASGERITADVCIIGAGAAGITLAREFVGTPVRVAVLESGGLTFDGQTQSLYDGQLGGVPYFALTAARLRFFGGTTNHWSGVCRPFAEHDFQRRPWVPYSGWPIQRAELEPFYKRATSIVHLRSDEFGVDYWGEQAKSGPLPLNGGVVTRPAQIVAEPLRRFATTYRAELEGARNAVTYLYANVVEIETDDSGATVSRVRVATLGGNEFSVAARAFVVAAGGIENPRLLLASDSRHPRGLGNQHDLVGRFFLEHPRFRAATVVPSDPQLQVGFYMPHSVRSSEIQGYLALSDERKRAEELVDVQIRVGPDYRASFTRALESDDTDSLTSLADAARGREPLDDFARHVSRVASDVMTWRRFTVPGSPLPVPYPEVLSRVARSDRVDRASLIPALLGDIAGYGYSKASGSTPLDSLVLTTRVESAPNPESRVTLVRRRDALGMRRVKLDWRLSELDKRSALRAVEIVAAELGRTGLGRLRLDVSERESGWPADTAGGWHHMGTTRMSDDPKLGVVDRHCRVHGMSNLFVAGSSVFPTAGSGTPTLTLVALALRLADHLKARFR
jgi:choline dehydrogenase-like flavoprotein